ncbi:MAG: DUF4250 domain-containing protein [Clostridia bacterium]|nr:DUF4250 domain-containing protein [Clostridia bacterium]
MYLPKDADMLLSVVNMCLRDKNPSLEDFCAENDADEEQLREKLWTAGYAYDEKSNSFKKRDR